MKNLRKIGYITAAFLVVAVLYLLITPRVYESESLLRIKQPQGLASSLLDAVPGANTAEAHDAAPLHGAHAGGQLDYIAK